MTRWCSGTYVSGYRHGELCPHRASEVIVPKDILRPFVVCGYHARAYTPDIRYDLNWTLEEKRRWQWANLDALSRRAAAASEEPSR